MKKYCYTNRNGLVMSWYLETANTSTSVVTGYDNLKVDNVHIVTETELLLYRKVSGSNLEGPCFCSVCRPCLLNVSSRGKIVFLNETYAPPSSLKMYQSVVWIF